MDSILFKDSVLAIASDTATKTIVTCSQYFFYRHKHEKLLYVAHKVYELSPQNAKVFILTEQVSVERNNWSCKVYFNSSWIFSSLLFVSFINYLCTQTNAMTTMK